ncbi:hypothetical protein protein [Bacillus cereus G9241]|nr:hypothetical protein protein [Bacillus cereus G9241]
MTTEAVLNRLLSYYENVWRSLFKISSKTDLGQPMLIRICSSPPNPYFSPGSTMIFPFSSSNLVRSS